MTAVLMAFEGTGGTGALVRWAKKNPTEFYKICARLIPHEVTGPGDDGAHVVKTIVHQHLTQAPTP
jgi:hypothetical protein